MLLEYRRLLHQEESKYFSKLAQEVAEHTEATRTVNYKPACEATQDAPVYDQTVKEAERSTSRTDKLSFGDGEAEIKSVEIFNNSGEHSNAFNPGDKIKIRVNCKINEDINYINVGIRIRNKEGVKIYS